MTEPAPASAPAASGPPTEAPAAPAAAARGGVPVLGVVLLLAVVVGALAAAFPPEYAHYAGQDASLYVNNALKDELDQPPASSFFPPEVATEDLDARQVGEAFTDGKFLDDGSGGLGRMTPFVPVSSAFEVRMIYDLLVSDVSSAALWAGAGQRDIGYINYALLFGTAVLVFLLGRELTGRNAASAAGALVITVIPSMVEGARLTMGEALATFLWLLLVYLVTRSRGRDQWAFLLLIPLCATRAEFLVVLAALAAWAGWRRSRSLVLGLAAVGCVVVEPTISLLNFFPPLAEYDVSTAILVVGPYLAGLLGRLAYDRWSPFGPTRDAPMPEQPSTRALQVFWAVAIGGFFAAEGIRRLLDEGQSVGPIRWQRFSTLDLLGSSLGWFTLVVGVIGLIAGSRLLIAKIPPVLAVMTAPMLFVFLWMSAFTPNEFLWTRRFHLLVYPALALGVTLALDALLRDRRLDRWGVPAAAVVGVLAILAPALGLRDLDRSLLSWENVSDFHASAQQIPDGSIVLLDTSGGALKAQLPMRTVDGLWTYIVWEPEPAQDLVPVLQATGRPVLAASSVVDELGLDTTGEVITLEVPVSDAEAYAVPLEVVASQQV